MGFLEVKPRVKRYEIAGLKIDMEPVGRTVAQAEPYASQSSGPADLTIKVDVLKLIEKSEWIKTEDVAYYMGSGSRFSTALLDHQGFMLHSSAVILDGGAYLFSAPSGTGKSTHTEKWIRLFGAEYLNDDKPALRLVDGVWMAYGTPWSGKHDLSKPAGVPLRGIAFLCRGDQNDVSPMDPAEALPCLMSQTVYQLPERRMDALLSLADDLLRRVPFWVVTCRNDDDAAILSRRVMTGEGL